MLAMAAIPIVCWIAVLIARPRRLVIGDEVAELVYGRLRGREDSLRLFAFVMTAVMLLVLVLSLPARVAPELRDAREARWRCDRVPTTASTCAEVSAGGTWITKRRQDDGDWGVAAIASNPPSFVRVADAACR